MHSENIFNVSSIITAHAEGDLAQYTIHSLFKAKEYAESQGLKVEIIAVLDSANSKTKNFFSKLTKKIRVEFVNFNDLGLARNHGVLHARGEYISFTDADDMMCEKWLFYAFNELKSLKDDVIAHPKYNIFFGQKNYSWKLASSLDQGFDKRDMLFFNHWDANCFAKKKIFEMFPYEETGNNTGFGYEDWHFNCKTFGSKIHHITISKTVNFIRRKGKSSLCDQHMKNNSTVRANKLFSYDNMKLENPLEYIDRKKIKGELPLWAKTELEKIKKIDPITFPPSDIFNDTMSHKFVDPPPWIPPYLEIMEILHDSPYYVFLISKLEVDRFCINYIHKLQRSSLQKIVIIFTDISNSSWKKHLPTNINFIEFKEKFNYLTYEEKIVLFCRLFVQFPPIAIHNVNSQLGCDLFIKYGRVLNPRTNLYIYQLPLNIMRIRVEGRWIQWNETKVANRRISPSILKPQLYIKTPQVIKWLYLRKNKLFDLLSKN